jgi:hypothetical protein
MSRGVLDKKVTRYLVGSVSNAPSVELCLKRSRSHLTPSSQSPSLPDDHCATTTLINGAVSTRVASRLRAGKMGVPAYSRSTPSTKRKAASFKLQSSELSSSQPHNTFPCGYLNTLSTSLCPHELHLKVTLIKLSIEMGKCLGETCADCLKSPMAELHMLGQSVCYNHGRSCLCNDTNASSLLPACFVPFSPQGARLSLNCQPPNIWNHFTVSLLKDLRTLVPRDLHASLPALEPSRCISRSCCQWRQRYSRWPRQKPRLDREMHSRTGLLLHCTCPRDRFQLNLKESKQ